MNKKNIVFHADDLGMTLGCNRAIKEAYDYGLLKSTSIMTNGLAFQDAIKSVVKECPDLKVGLHINISENPEGAKNLFGANFKPSKTRFYKSFLSTFFYSFNKSYLESLEKEIRSQFKKAESALGKINHVDSHEHFCAIPKIFEIVSKLCVEFKVKNIRIANEPFYLSTKLITNANHSVAKSILKWLVLYFFSHFNKAAANKYNLSYSKCFAGILFSGHMNEKNSILILNKLLPKFDEIELLFHPARFISSTEETYFSSKSRNYCLNPSRADELETLTSNSFYDYVSHHMHLETKTAQHKKLKDNKLLKVFCIFDEEEFFHPNLLNKLINNNKSFEIVGIGIVKFERGSILKQYFIKNMSKLGIVNILFLMLKSLTIFCSSITLKYLGITRFSSCLEVAKNMDTPHRLTNDIGTIEFKKWVKSFAPDFIISSNSLIFDNELIKIPSNGCLNRHSSLIPSNRGIFPIFRSIVSNHSFTGVTIHKMTKKIDAGDIICQFAFPIYKDDTVNNLYKTCFDISYHLLLESLKGDQKSQKSISPYMSSYYSFPNNEDWENFKDKKIKLI